MTDPPPKARSLVHHVQRAVNRTTAGGVCPLRVGLKLVFSDAASALIEQRATSRGEHGWKDTAAKIL